MGVDRNTRPKVNGCGQEHMSKGEWVWTGTHVQRRMGVDRNICPKNGCGQKHMGRRNEGKWVWIGTHVQRGMGVDRNTCPKANGCGQEHMSKGEWVWTGTYVQRMGVDRNTCPEANRCGQEHIGDRDQAPARAPNIPKGVQMYAMRNNVAEEECTIQDK